MLFGAIFVAVGYYFYLTTRPSYEGQLTAERLDPNQSIRVELRGTTFSIDQQVFSQIINELRERPSTVRSNLVELQFQSGAEGISIGLRPGYAADLVRVPVMQHQDVAAFYQDHQSQLEDDRLAEMQAGLVSLCEDWAVAPEGEKNERLPKYRHAVVYNSFVRGLGRIVYADVNNHIYPCVHEDAQGTLYFLIPSGTNSFHIRERIDLPECPVFPSTLDLAVTLQRPTLEPAEIVPAASSMSDESTPLDEANVEDTPPVADDAANK